MPLSPIPRVLLVLLAGAAFTMTMAGVQATAGIIGPAFLALVLTITVHPARVWLRRHRVPEWLASIGIIVTVYVVILVISLALVVSLARLAELLPSYAPQIKEDLNGLSAWLEERGIGTDQVEAMVASLDFGSLISLATELLGKMLGVLSDLFFIFTLVLFLAFDTDGTTRTLAALESRRSDLVGAMRSFAQGTRRYMVVSTVFGLIVATLDWGALLLIGVPGAFVWGVLAFVTNYIPNIGFIIGLVPPAIIGLLEGGPQMMIMVIAVYCALNVVIQTVIQPRVVGDQVGLSATVTFLSLVFWTWAIGPLGALLAVPLSLLTRAVLIEADPGARWTLPLVSGKPEAIAEADPLPAGGPSEAR